MELNEAGQVLLPLTGIDKDKLFELCESAEIGLMFNNENAKDYHLFILANRNVKLGEYLSRFNADTRDVGVLKRLFIVPALDKFKETWRLVMKGKYSLADKKVVHEVILPTLKGNRKVWRDVFYRDDESLKRLVTSRLSGSYAGKELEEHVKSTIKDMKLTKTSMELKKPIARKDNKISYEY